MTITKKTFEVNTAQRIEDAKAALALVLKEKKISEKVTVAISKLASEDFKENGWASTGVSVRGINDLVIAARNGGAPLRLSDFISIDTDPKAVLRLTREYMGSFYCISYYHPEMDKVKIAKENRVGFFARLFGGK